MYNVIYILYSVDISHNQLVLNDLKPLEKLRL